MSGAGEIRVGRITLVDEAGRERAVIETTPPRSDEPLAGSGVRLSLFAATGDPMLVAEVDSNGQPKLHVGHPDRGTTVTIERGALSVWKNGNEVAALYAQGGGKLMLCDRAGHVELTLPEREG